MRIRISRQPDAVEIVVDDTLVAVHPVPINGPYQVDLGRLTGLNEPPDTMEIDRLFVRRYASVPPSVSMGPEQ